MGRNKRGKKQHAGVLNDAAKPAPKQDLKQNQKRPPKETPAQTGKKSRNQRRNERKKEMKREQQIQAQIQGPERQPSNAAPTPFQSRPSTAAPPLPAAALPAPPAPPRIPLRAASTGNHIQMPTRKPAPVGRSNTAPPQAPSVGSSSGNHNVNRAFTYAPTPVEQMVKRKQAPARPQAAPAPGPRTLYWAGYDHNDFRNLPGKGWVNLGKNREDKVWTLMDPQGSIWMGAPGTPLTFVAAAPKFIPWQGNPDDWKDNLPAGFKRVSVDTREDIHTFRDDKGREWMGKPRTNLMPAEAYMSEMRRNMPSGTAHLQRKRTDPVAPGHKFENFASLRSVRKGGKEAGLVLSNYVKYDDHVKASIKAGEVRMAEAERRVRNETSARAAQREEKEKKARDDDRKREAKRLRAEHKAEKKKLDKMEKEWHEGLQKKLKGETRGFLSRWFR